jgi:vitamin B12 transporter
MKKLIFFLTGTMFLQVANAQDSTLMQEVVVSANKFPSKTSTTGKVVTVIGRAQIEQSGSKDLAQLLTEQAGVYVNGAFGNPGKDKSVYIRGAKVDHTLIVIDGIPVYDPSGIGSNFDIRLLALDQIERIEILKGSQSTLYGSDAMAGVIHITTRKASSKKIEASGRISYGSYNTMQIHGEASGSHKKWNYSVQQTYLKTTGIDEALDTATIPNVRDKDGFTQQQFRVQGGYRPTEKTLIQPFIRYSTFKQAYDQGAFTDELDLDNQNRNVQAGLHVESQLGKLKTQLNYSFSDHHRSFTDDSTLSRNGFSTFSKGMYAGQEQLADLFGWFPIHKRLRMTVGADFRSSSSNQEFMSLSVFGPFESKLGSDSLNQRQWGVYGALLAQPHERFNVEIGGRWNNHSTYGSNGVFNINPSWQVDDNWKLFSNISSAYKTPTLYQLFSEYGNRELKPEQALTYEGGVQHEAIQQGWGFRAVYFQREVKQAIAFYTDPLTYASKYINQDQQLDQGWEFDAHVRLTKRSDFRFQGSWIDGKTTTQQNGKDTTYFNLFRRPKSSFSMQWNCRPQKHWQFRVGLLYVGERKDLSYDVNFVPVVVNLKPFANLDLYGEYRLNENGKGISVYVDLRNVTNENYAEIFGYRSMGFNGSLGLRFSR